MFEQLWWASASELIARIENQNDVGIARSKCVLNFGGRRGTNQNSELVPFWNRKRWRQFQRKDRSWGPISL